IIMHPNVWRASGHLGAGFTDPMVDCKDCKERGRADKWPQQPVGTQVEYKVIVDHKSGKKETRKGEVGKLGIVCPQCGSPNMSDTRRFNLMFRTSLGSLDPTDIIAARLEGKALQGEDLKKAISEAIGETAVYLRPETAQAMFVNFLNVQASARMRPP